jgi:hypothetical protein
MKPQFALAAALTVALVLPAIATASEYVKDKPNVEGTITAWNAGTRQATIADSAGKEISFEWNANTKVAGTAKVGEQASVAYTTDKAGKNVATHVRIREKSEHAKPPASQ